MQRAIYWVIGALDICFGKSKSAFEKYVKYKNIVLIEVKVNQVGIWNDNGREYLDVEKGEAYRVG